MPLLRLHLQEDGVIGTWTEFGDRVAHDMSPWPVAAAEAEQSREQCAALRTMQHECTPPSCSQRMLMLAQDTVAVQELRWGDNDTLSAQVCR